MLDGLLTLVYCALPVLDFAFVLLELLVLSYQFLVRRLQVECQVANFLSLLENLAPLGLQVDLHLHESFSRSATLAVQARHFVTHHKEEVLSAPCKRVWTTT